MGGNGTGGDHHADRRVFELLLDQPAHRFDCAITLNHEMTILTDSGKRTMAQAALRFILDTPGVTSVIPGSKSREQLDDNAGAMDVPPLSDEERTRAMAIADSVEGFGA